jgi:hypothetical protein
MSKHNRTLFNLSLHTPHMEDKICALCKKRISHYNPMLNRMVIDEKDSADICQPCIDKFCKWQGEIYSKLFPTKALKKRFGKDLKQQ